VSRVLTNGQKVEAAGAAGDKFGSRYTSDIFAMIGTVFLWMFWPSFNGALADGNAEHRVIVNTVLSLTASCFTAFLASKFFREGHRLDMVDIQNATLAGGVAIGTGADSMVGPAGALTVGAIAGILSVVGYVYISPVLEGKLKIHDTCGVHNLHGMPGVLGAVVGAIAAGSATASVYGDDQLSSVYGIGSGARSAGEQMGYQLLALVVTLSIAMVGGALTGCIMSLVPGSAEYGEDAKNWTIEEESAPLTHAEPVSVSKCVAEAGATGQKELVPEAEAECTTPRGHENGMEAASAFV
jgi:ammonium transporter Rh